MPRAASEDVEPVALRVSQRNLSDTTPSCLPSTVTPKGAEASCLAAPHRTEAVAPGAGLVDLDDIHAGSEELPGETVA
jgi:hypothetical protein